MSGMSSDDAPQYDLEPDSDEPPPESPESPESPVSPVSPAKATLKGDSPPHPATEATSPRGGVEALDVCPNCGASMRDINSVVCMRCGFNLKDLKQVKTRVGADVASEDVSEPASHETLVRPDFGGVWFPLAAAAISAVILSIGFLAGSGGLFQLAESPSLGERLVALLRFVLATGVLTAGGVTGLFGLARLEKRHVGDLGLAAARMLSVVATMQLVRFIDLPERPKLEHSVELLLEAAAFVGLSILMLRLTPRQASALLGLTAVGVIGVTLLANAIAWSVVP
jgi:hypothetical protein